MLVFFFLKRFGQCLMFLKWFINKADMTNK